MKKKDVYYKELRKFIKSQNMTFKRFATDVLHINPMTLNYKFNGRLAFSLDDIILIRDYFNLSPMQVDMFFLHERSHRKEER